MSTTGSANAFDAIIVGAGISGMYMLHRLREQGLSVRVIDQAGGVGGTWYWNRYPGARCDIESMTYSYSFDEELEQEWTWSERYAAQPEILRYLEHVADRHDLRRDMQLSTRVTRATWSEDEARWTVETDAGDTYSATWFLLGTGCLSVPRYPDIPGRERFLGEAYHTGTWPHEPVSFAGKRVAVIGTGSSAVQAIPLIAQEAAELVVFQRTPNFSIPAFNRPLTEAEVAERKRSYRAMREQCRWTSAGNPWSGRPVSIWDESPEERAREFEERYRVGGFYIHSAYSDLFDDAEANEALSDFVRDKIRSRVDDPATAELLCPYDHPLATKRMCVDTDYYETYNRENVRLVDVRATPIDAITERGIACGGEELPFDMIVYATGFDAMTGALMRMDVRGAGGLTIQEKWADGPHTYLGIAVAGFPNMLMTIGPGSPSVLSNMMVSIEQHVDFIVDCVAWMRAHGHATIEPTAEAERAWVDHVREVGEATLYPRAKSWYMGANVPGKPRVLLPYVAGVGRYRQECDRIAASGYEGFAIDRATAGARAD